jgi:hypothetical protein
MSALTAAAIVGAIALAANTGYTIYKGERAANMQDDAQRLSMAEAQKTARAADEATNRANQKRPNANAILAAAQQAAKGGVGGTLLTGPQGVNTGELSLGKSTLLGG